MTSIKARLGQEAKVGDSVGFMVEGEPLMMVGVIMAINEDGTVEVNESPVGELYVVKSVDVCVVLGK